MDMPITILVICRPKAEFHLIGRLLAQIHHTDYQVIWLNRLDDGLEAMVRGNCDVVLLDYHWNNGSAMQAVRTARSRGCTLPIVVMTDDVESEVDRTAIAAGASDYLIKGQIDSLLLERTLRYAMERNASEKKLAQLAHFDPLANIPNRILFRDRLEHAVELSRREGIPFALLYLDLDGFKEINDRCGHDAGDEVIRQCARRLKECIRKSDSVARIGGDEFTILLEHTNDPTHIAHVAQKVIDTLSQAMSVGAEEVSVGVSIGVAVYPEAGDDAQSLQKHADTAMYQAKQIPGSAYCFYTASVGEPHPHSPQESELRQALRGNQIEARYRRRLNAASGSLIELGLELRWHHPERGLVGGEHCRDVAQQAGLTAELNDWSLQQGLQDLAQLQKAGWKQLCLMVPVSAAQLTDPNIRERLERLLVENGVRGESLGLELTEADLAEHRQAVLSPMVELVQLGCHFSLAEFGCGSASLGLLQRLPVTSVRIAEPLLVDAGQTEAGRRLLEGLVQFAHHLGKAVVAGGYCDHEQHQSLCQLGCDLVNAADEHEPQTLAAIQGRSNAAAVTAVAYPARGS